MGKTTDELVKMAYQVSPHPNRRELDMLLTTGDKCISMSLLSMALSDFGVPAISFTGQSSRSDDRRIPFLRAHFGCAANFACAKNSTADASWFWPAFRGVNPVTKEITTLGRGGSDTTAVAMAAALKAECCEIIKEVDGVCSADPHIVPDSKPLRQLDLHRYQKCVFGRAKVLHFRRAWSWHKAKTFLWF